jgi:hypothetical protein
VPMMASAAPAKDAKVALAATSARKE